MVHAQHGLHHADQPGGLQRVTQVRLDAGDRDFLAGRGDVVCLLNTKCLAGQLLIRLCLDTTEAANQ